MGARTNIAIKHSKDERENINVYLHWGADALGVLTAAVRNSKPRWGDTSYALHIILDELMRDCRDSETGCGVYVGETITHEEEYTYKKIDLTNQTVQYGHLIMSFDDFLSKLSIEVM